MSVALDAGRPSATTEPATRARWRARPLMAELVVLGLVLGGALALRLIGIGNDTDLSDEGIRGVQLRLLAAGFTPVSEIYASQGPLSLVLFAPFYLLLGADLTAARLATVFWSMLCVVAAYGLGRVLAGPPAALAAALLLGVSPVFLEGSRRAYVEVPSLVPAMLSLLLLARWRTTGRRGWLVGSAALLAVGVLAKPMVAVVGIAALALIVAGPRSRTGVGDEGGVTSRVRVRPGLLNVAVFTGVGLLVVAVVVLAIGPAAIWEQVVGYRVAALAARGWSLAQNWGVIRAELGREGVGLLALALVGATVAIRRRSALAVGLLAWLLAGFGMLLAYSPLWPKHVAYLLPPVAVLGGVAVGTAATLRVPRPPPTVIPALAAGVALVLWLATLPTTILSEDRALIERRAGGDAARYADDLRTVAVVTGPDDFIVMDDAYLAALTGRLTPPFLADLSWNRILARALTPEQAIAETRRFDTRVVVVQDDHLGQLNRYLAWLDREYVLVKSYGQRRPNRFRRVYVHPGVDVDSLKATLLAGLDTPIDAPIGPVLLHGYSLEWREWKPGSRYGLTLFWEARESLPPEHALMTRLRDAAGRAVLEQEWKLGDAGQELHTWQAGRWQVQALRLLADDVPPGTYTLTVGLDRPAQRGAAPPPGERSLGTVTVVRGDRDPGE